MFAIGEVDAAEWDLEDVRVMLDGFVFFGGLAVEWWWEMENVRCASVMNPHRLIDVVGNQSEYSRKGIIVRDASDPLKLWIERIDGGLGSFHPLDVCFLGYQVLRWVRNDMERPYSVADGSPWRGCEGRDGWEEEGQVKQHFVG